jgi:hypothetical protein
MSKNNIIIIYKMDILKSIFNGLNVNTNEQFLLTMLIIYIVFDIETPSSIAIFIDNTVVKAIIYLIALSSFSTHSPFTAIVAVIAASVLISRSSAETGGAAAVKYIPSELTKLVNMEAVNADNIEQYTNTLEEDIVSTMAPIMPEGPVQEASYLPVLDSFDASPIETTDMF